MQTAELSLRSKGVRKPNASELQYATSVANTIAMVQTWNSDEDLIIRYGPHAADIVDGAFFEYSSEADYPSERRIGDRWVR